MAAGQPRRILVTGAGGFVGGHLLTAIRGALPSAELFTDWFDIADAAAVRHAVRAARPDACVHLAAIAAIPAAQKDPDEAWRVNLHGTLSLARTLMQDAPDCALLFVSTSDAYGATFKSGVMLDETAALNPMNTYGATKAAADLALGAMAREGLRVIRARPFNHTGPGQSDAFVVASFARQVALVAAGKQDATLMVGALDSERDFLDVRDVCACYLQCLLRADRIPSGTIFNIASGQPRKVGDVLADLIDIAGVKVTVSTDPGRLRTAEIPLAAGNPAQAKRLLDWQPAIPWRQTLTDVLAYWRTTIGATQD
ncbi:GDP-mannose 4,6-dehydratase [Acidisphaera sp. L21]|uniref:GDP-mannose 4,6-dehydratase n=1 Tax=Acidisphaera sp. L21 TaxID=1641851 RepID=UPI00131E7353|nr:GDP-mannose 4,6-dehydratase [Acidisphaera sp. L21]